MERLKIAVAGAGGKTTALKVLAQQLMHRRVLLTTTTHIGQRQLEKVCRRILCDPTKAQLLAALEETGAVCAGVQAEGGKLVGLAPELMQEAMTRADVTVYEADGAHGKPLKLHRPWEPVVVDGTELCLVVAGLSALGKTVEQAVHCYDRNPLWQAQPETTVGEEEFLFCVRETVRSLNIVPERVKVFLNQQDCADVRQAQRLVSALRAEGLDCESGSLQTGGERFCHWLMT